MNTTNQNELIKTKQVLELIRAGDTTSVAIGKVFGEPADKWAAEKAAYAQGKRIECRYRSVQEKPWETTLIPSWLDEFEYRIAPYPAQTYHTHTVVQQRREEAAAINAAMNPAPAGKLTDEKLGEIGAKAAAITINRPERVDYFTMTVTARSAFYDRDEPARTAFASAVREAVEAKQADEIARLTAELERLKDELGTVNIERAETRDIRAEMVKAWDELYKANAELERLRWRSPKIKPSRGDADITGGITVLKRDGIVTQILWYSEELNAFEAWRPCCPPPAPSAEEVERAEFAAFWDRSELAGIVKEEGAFKIWQAARAAKEGEK